MRNWIVVGGLVSLIMLTGAFTVSEPIMNYWKPEYVDARLKTKAEKAAQRAAEEKRREQEREIARQKEIAEARKAAEWKQKKIAACHAFGGHWGTAGYNMQAQVYLDFSGQIRTRYVPIPYTGCVDSTIEITDQLVMDYVLPEVEEDGTN